MKAIVNTAPNELKWLDWPLPEPGHGQVRIRTGACGICATDIFMIAGWERTGYPSIPGHEWAGIVDAVGEGIDPGLVGMHCVANNVLADGGEVGFEHPGGYGECFLTEADKLLALPGSFPLSTAVLIEPLAVCVRALRRLRLEDRRAALIFGDGPIGLILVMLLRQAGVEQISLVGGREGRLALAEGLGAGRVINYHTLPGELSSSLAAMIPPPPNIFEASGSAAAMQAAMNLAGHGGKVSVIGDYGEGRAGFLWNQVLHKELEIIGSNAHAGAWEEAVHLAVEGALPLGRLVTHCMPAEQFAQGIALTAGRSGEVVKVVLDWSAG